MFYIVRITRFKNDQNSDKVSNQLRKLMSILACGRFNEDKDITRKIETSQEYSYLHGVQRRNILRLNPSIFVSITNTHSFRQNNNQKLKPHRLSYVSPLIFGEFGNINYKSYIKRLFNKLNKNNGENHMLAFIIMSIIQNYPNVQLISRK